MNTNFEQEIHSLTQELSDYIHKGLTAFHAAQRSVEMLDEAGAIRLSELDSWQLEEKKLYYVLRDYSSVIAFYSGSRRESAEGVLVTGAHLDSPALKLKGRALEISEGTLCASVEVYGGPIFATWLDRDLVLAGRVVVRDGDSLSHRLFALTDLGAIIPNVAIHMNREINNGVSYNPQTELRVLLYDSNAEMQTDIHQHIARSLSIKAEDIVDAETFVVSADFASAAGLSNPESAILRSSRIDNLAGSHASLKGLLNAVKSGGEKALFSCLYNSEEIGSRTRSGADSSFFSRILDRYFLAMGMEEEKRAISRQKSFQVSIDAAHAVHPNYAAKHDGQFKPMINKGIVLKRSAKYKYGTDSLVAARLLELARVHNLPMQEMVNRADVPGGSTIGTISMTLLDIPTVDIGIALLAMHSVRESAGLLDQMYMLKLIEAFYTNPLSQIS